VALLCLAPQALIRAQKVAPRYDVVEHRNAWNAGENVTGILTDTTSVAYAEAYGHNVHGGFHDANDAGKTWSAGVETKSITHLKRLSLIGSFGFDNTSGREMAGSMFIHPGFYPVDAIEFTPGRKDKQTYAFMGGIAGEVGSHWRIGGKAEFTSTNYTKRKDIRHTNYRLDFKIAPSVAYHRGDYTIGLTYLLGKNSETMTAKKIGTAENTPYYAFLDKGLMYGTYGTWDGSGLHLKETGINGFPLREVSNGAALQLAWRGAYADVAYSHASGEAGERESIWYKFPSDRVSSHLSYHFTIGRSRHFARLNLDWARQTNREAVMNSETANGITIVHVYAYNQIFERKSLTLNPEYELMNRWGEFRIGTEYSITQSLVTQMYPYTVSQKLQRSNSYFDVTLHLGRVDLLAAGSFAIGKRTDSDQTLSTDQQAGEPPYRLTDFYNLQMEYATASRAALRLGARYNFRIGLYAEATVEGTHGFNLRYITGGNNRWNETLRVGYVF
jgi:hypothetical protein